MCTTTWASSSRLTLAVGTADDYDHGYGSNYNHDYGRGYYGDSYGNYHHGGSSASSSAGGSASAAAASSGRKLLGEYNYYGYHNYHDSSSASAAASASGGDASAAASAASSGNIHTDNHVMLHSECSTLIAQRRRYCVHGAGLIRTYSLKSFSILHNKLTSRLGHLYLVHMQHHYSLLKLCSFWDAIQGCLSVSTSGAL